MKHEQDIQPPLTPLSIVRITGKGDGFGVTPEGSSVYISPTLVADYNIEQGTVRNVRLVNNSPGHIERGVPYRAYFIEPIFGQMELPLEWADDEPAEPVEVSLEDRIALALDRAGVLSTAELSQKTDVESPILRRTLDRMHKGGELARADVYAPGVQSKAGRALWAQTVQDFLEGRK